MTWCLCCKSSEASKGESPVIDMSKPLVVVKNTEVVNATEDIKIDDETPSSILQQTRKENPKTVENKSTVQNPNPKPTSSSNPNDDDHDRPIAQAKNLQATGWWETDEPGNTGAQEPTISRTSAGFEAGNVESKVLHNINDGGSPRLRDFARTPKEKIGQFTNTAAKYSYPNNNATEDACDKVTVSKPAASVGYSKQSNDDGYDALQATNKVTTMNVSLNSVGREGNDDLDEQTLSMPKSTRHNTNLRNGDDNANNAIPNNNAFGSEKVSMDNKWDLDGDQHVEVGREYDYTIPVFSGNGDATMDDEPPSSPRPVTAAKSRVRPLGRQPVSEYGNEVSTTPKSIQIPADMPNDETTTQERQSFNARPGGPRSAKPLPLKRGARTVPVRRRMEPSKPTAASVTKLMEKLANLVESKWSEQIKCQNELCEIAGKYPEVLRECDPVALIAALRAITLQANSGRSNVSKGGITCLGSFCKACGPMLNTGLGDVVDVCSRKAASGSPDFICSAANITLAKICLSGPEAKLATILLQKHKTNKSAHAVILNCIIILLDRLGPELEKLKVLPDIVAIGIAALTAGSLNLRAAGKIVMGLVNEQTDIIELLRKWRKGDDAIRTVRTALQKYKEAEKVTYLENLTSDAI